MFLYNILIFRTWPQALALNISIFVLMEVIAECNHLDIHDSSCRAEDFASWTWYANALQAGAFIATCLLEISFLSATKLSRKIISSAFVTFWISFQSGMSSIMSLRWNWGGVCEDILG